MCGEEDAPIIGGDRVELRSKLGITCMVLRSMFFISINCH